VFAEFVRGPRGLRLTRRQQVFLLCLIPVVVGFSVWGLQGSTAAGEDPQSATVARGNMVVTVGGVGRIVQANAPEAIARPSPPSGGGGTGSAAATDAPADAVFPHTTGQIERYLVRRGQRVVAGQALAVLSDGGAAAGAVRQAANELATARLELRQKRTSDPLKGIPPTSAELAMGQAQVTAAQEKLDQLLRGPRRADILVAWQELRKAEADLEAVQGGTAAARSGEILVARRALAAAEDRLERALKPDPADMSAATAELRKAEAELAVLQRALEGPLPEEIAAARQAVANAEAALAEQKAAVPPDQAAIRVAQLDLDVAKADLAKLLRQGPTPEEIASARQAVDAARAKLDKLLRPGGNQAEVKAARVEVERARADLRRLESGPSKVTLAGARASVEAAEAKLNQLLGPPLRADVALARFDIEKAKAELEVLRTRGAPGSPDEIALAQLKVDRAQILLQSARQTARALTVRAPAAGTVTALLSVPGAPVDTTTPVAAVSNLDRLAVVVNLSEFDVAKVRRGHKAEVSIDALGGESFAGKVLFAAATGVESNGIVTFPVQIAVGETEGLKPGMNVSVRIVVAQKRNVLQVPLEAVNQEEDEPLVTVLDSAGEPTERTVETGLENSKNIEILEGLREGDRVELLEIAPAEEGEE
jgi:RND family efflux transporter MFP subunit